MWFSQGKRNNRKKRGGTAVDDALSLSEMTLFNEVPENQRKMIDRFNELQFQKKQINKELKQLNNPIKIILKTFFKDQCVQYVNTHPPQPELEQEPIPLPPAPPIRIVDSTISIPVPVPEPITIKTEPEPSMMLPPLPSTPSPPLQPTPVPILFSTNKKRKLHQVDSYRVVSVQRRKPCTQKHVFQCIVEFMLKHHAFATDEQCESFASKLTGFIFDQLPCVDSEQLQIQTRSGDNKRHKKKKNKQQQSLLHLLTLDGETHDIEETAHKHGVNVPNEEELHEIVMSNDSVVCKSLTRNKELYSTPDRDQDEDRKILQPEEEPTPFSIRDT